MTNKCRINKAIAALVDAGILRGYEFIYTKNAWRKMGYKVNKDENPITTIPIYIYAPHKSYDKEGNRLTVKKLLNVKANFYTLSQVTEIKEAA